jgi:hypothetical protein
MSNRPAVRMDGFGNYNVRSLAALKTALPAIVERQRKGESFCVTSLRRPRGAVVSYAAINVRRWYDWDEVILRMENNSLPSSWCQVLRAAIYAEVAP